MEMLYVRGIPDTEILFLQVCHLLGTLMCGTICDAFLSRSVQIFRMFLLCIHDWLHYWLQNRA